jgi:head-tail adaptor
VEEGELFMSLLTQMMEDCKILNHIRIDDDFGGYTDTWSEGATFKAAIAKNSSPEQLVAEQQGVSEQFTVVVDRNFSLDYHDVFKRLSDNSIFRVTSRTTDSTAHPASTVKIAKVTAERWVLPA